MDTMRVGLSVCVCKDDMIMSQSSQRSPIDKSEGKKNEQNQVGTSGIERNYCHRFGHIE